jgi:hypothetical protein
MARMEALNGRSDLRAHLARTNGGGSLLEIDAWIPSEIEAIPPRVDRMMRLIHERELDGVFLARDAVLLLQSNASVLQEP